MTFKKRMARGNFFKKILLGFSFVKKLQLLCYYNWPTLDSKEVLFLKMNITRLKDPFVHKKHQLIAKFRRPKFQRPKKGI